MATQIFDDFLKNQQAYPLWLGVIIQYVEDKTNTPIDDPVKVTYQGDNGNGINHLHIRSNGQDFDIHFQGEFIEQEQMHIGQDYWYSSDGKLIQI